MDSSSGGGGGGGLIADDEQSREAELICRIHRAVGGPAKLSTYDDPAAVRQVVLDALAAEYTSGVDVARVRRGDLTAFERRVVRTVTNRGAAVRSRMRQRRELARLRDELRTKDERIAKLEAALATFTHTHPQAQAHTQAQALLPTSAPQQHQQHQHHHQQRHYQQQHQGQLPPQVPPTAPGSEVWAAAAVPAVPPSPIPPAPSRGGGASSSGAAGGGSESSGTVTPAVSPAGMVGGVECEAFGNLIDQMLSRI